MQSVTEKSTAYLTVVCKDKLGVAQTPATFTYRVDDVYTDTQVRGDTSLTPASQIEITLTLADNTILNSLHSYEKRRVTVVAVYGIGDQVTDEFIYEVVNLSKVT